MDWLKIAVVVCLWSTTTFADEYQLLHFEATWCGPCATLNEHLRDKTVLATLKAGKIKLLNIDVDTDAQGVTWYKVDEIPTCILVRVNAKRQATVIRRKVGLMTLQELVTFLKLPVAAPAPPAVLPKKG